jgi:hypothetical protein
MRFLVAAVIGMGILILAGVAVIGVTIAHRVGHAIVPAGGAQAVLDEPAGSRIAGVALGADWLAVQLQGGGPDRVVVVDLRDGRVLARAALAH